MDWDEDGDLDLLVGERDGYVNLYINSGTATNPVLDAGVRIQDGTSDIMVANSSPLPVDWDNDGDKDLMLGSDEDGILLYDNIGTNEAPLFDGHTVIIAPAISYPAIGNWRNRPRLLDLNSDGLVDILTGNESGQVAYYQNIGTADTPAFSAPPIPLLYEDETEINISARCYLELYDWDNDGMEDLIIGAWDGEMYFLRQAPPASPDAPAAPSDFVAIADPAGTFSAQLNWTCPALSFDGNPLTELTEIIIYRDNEVIHTDTNPVIGNYGEYTDNTITSSGFYTYKIQAANSFGVSPKVQIDPICIGNGSILNVFIQCDNYGSETTWNLFDSEATIINSGGPYGADEAINVNCILDAGDYTFTIYDSYGDGINSGYGEGYYTLTLDEVIIFEGDGTFTSEESTSFTVAGPMEAPSNLAVETLSGLFTWEAPSDVTVTGFEIYLDNEMQGNTAELNWTFTGLLNGTTYQAGIVAVYEVGSSNMVTIDFTYDGTDAPEDLPLVTKLQGNYPNPFNPTTKISFSTLENSDNTNLGIYNIKGQLVKTLVNEVLTAGQHSVVWQGNDDSGKSVSSGIYFYKMKTGNYTSVKKMILMK